MKKKSLNNPAEQLEAKIASDSLFMQIDNNLSIISRLGIPTSSTDDLNASVTATNTAKLIYNSTLQKLRIYNPLTSSWTDANPESLADYYTKEQIDSLLSALPSATPLTFNNGMWVKDGAVQLGLDMTTLGTTNVGKLQGTTAFLIGDPHTEASFTAIGDGSVNSMVTTSKYQLENGIGLSGGKYQASARLTLTDLINVEKSAGFNALIDEGRSNATMYAANRGFNISWDSIQADHSAFNVFDRDNLKGMVYDADYSLKGKADSRWIPDWGTVKAEINSSIPASPALTAGNGLTKIDNTIKLGGTLTETTIFPLAAGVAYGSQTPVEDGGGFLLGTETNTGTGLVEHGIYSKGGMMKIGLQITKEGIQARNIGGSGIRYTGPIDWTSASQQTLMPKTYIDAKGAEIRLTIPKMFAFTASGDGVATKFRVPHGLTSPVAVSITPNSKDALGKCYDGSDNIVYGGGVFAYIDGADIVIENLQAENPYSAFPAGTDNLKWTITVK